MVRHKGKVEVRIAQLRDFAEKLRAVADTCESNCDLAESKGLEALAVTHFATGADGIESISKFVGAVYIAATEAMLKQTLQAAESPAAYATKKPASRKSAKD